VGWICSELAKSAMVRELEHAMKAAGGKGQLRHRRFDQRIIGFV
jgi:hypothetical protein